MKTNIRSSAVIAQRAYAFSALSFSPSTLPPSSFVLAGHDEERESNRLGPKSCFCPVSQLIPYLSPSTSSSAANLYERRSGIRGCKLVSHGVLHIEAVESRTRKTAGRTYHKRYTALL